MTTPLPIACTLTGDELLARLDEIRDLSRHALRAKTTDGTHAVLSFDPAPGVRDRLATIVAAEARCCAFLTMQLADEPDALTLTIDAPADAEAVLEELLSSFELVAT
jgi:methylaspartate ammonia-lyase